MRGLAVIPALRGLTAFGVNPREAVRDGRFCNLANGVPGANRSLRGHDDLGDSVLRWRERGDFGVGFGLIPVGDGVKVVGTIVGVAVLDGDLDGFFEGDEAFGVPAVEAIAAAGALGVDDVGRALAHVGEGVAVEIPCAVVVVLCTGAVDGGLSVAVDEEHVVAFAEPAIGVLEDALGDADEVAAAGGFKEDIVVGAVEILVAAGGFLVGAVLGGSAGTVV